MEPDICPDCGSPLSGDVGLAICGRCLMRGLMEDDDPSAKEDSQPDSQQPEQRIAGYRIIGELGRGGMGLPVGLRRSAREPPVATRVVK